MTQDNGEATRLVSDYASALVRSMLVVSESLRNLDHTTSKGTLRELLVSSLLKRFLSSQFSVSSGLIVNHGGEQSNQMDVIILDNRVLPPFINATDGKAWLQAHVKALHAVALAAHYSWILMRDDKTKQGGWRAGLAVPESDAYEEPKRFFAVLLDNCRTAAEKRWRTLTGHRDWFSQYIRDQDALPRASTEVRKGQGAQSAKQLASSKGTPVASSLMVPPNTKVDYAGTHPLKPNAGA